MSTPELKPCPFCGKVPSTELINGTLAVFCGNNECLVAVDVWSEHAIKDWNTRHNPAEPALNAAREAIETELKFAEFEQRQRLRAALAQIDKALSPQQSKTT